MIPPRPGSEIAFCQQKLSKKSFVFGALRFLGTVMSPSSFKKSVTWHLPQQIFNLNEWLLDNFPMIFGAKILSRDILSRDFGRSGIGLSQGRGWARPRLGRRVGCELWRRRLACLCPCSRRQGARWIEAAGSGVLALHLGHGGPMRALSGLQQRRCSSDLEGRVCVRGGFSPDAGRCHLGRTATACVEAPTRRARMWPLHAVA